MSLGHEQMAPCRTHILLPGQGHRALQSQFCLVGSWATRRRCVSGGGELRVHFWEVGMRRGFGDLWDY